MCTESEAVVISLSLAADPTCVLQRPSRRVRGRTCSPYACLPAAEHRGTQVGKNELVGQSPKLESPQGDLAEGPGKEK